ncbi:hypothetical protein A2368_02160 [Candidatus Collierbacteria bacterium RIFOXYB1_FULL_49_13]|uniref:Nudix hydrolase domain-containing protein n=1 Tax=Candidatus Collierbacteria bacterium RIFOXYB1_FULL_49_13 TaxID=1817728 RepID=A0A1F5FGN2_9BACT|nr:MAG: hypothetical protein A2368_02160 [Candidatus Collierbacteria bacterium RIFOXYB1_FULL_49_13]
MQPQIKVRVRLVIIQDGKILLSHTKGENFYFYIGGKMDFGETIPETCIREIVEECAGSQFTFKKILYIREFILGPDHSIEFFVLGDIKASKDLHNHVDPEFKGDHTEQWIPLTKLPNITIYPQTLTPVLLSDYAKGFTDGIKYLGPIK